MTPRRLLSEVTSVELTKLLAYQRAEPFGPPADLHGPAQVAAAVLNAAGGRGPGQPPFEPSEFVPGERAADGLIAKPGADLLASMTAWQAVFEAAARQGGNS
jgi:hypothetical protein